MSWVQIVSLAIFLVTFVVIFSERIHRVIAGIAGALVMLLFGITEGFYSQKEAFEAIDFNTILLLLWMMLVVAILEKTGFLEYVATRMAQKSGGKQWPLLLFLGTATSLLSTMLDNVTTVVVIGPVTLSICRVLAVNPVPYLLAEAILSNTGGVATLIGDPPNVIIGSVAGFTFNDFLIHTAPVALVAWAATLFIVKFLFRGDLARPSSKFSELMAMDPKEHLKDWPSARKVLIVLAGTMVLFVLHGVLHLEASTVAFIGFATALVWVRPDPEEILKSIDWNVLMFFSALFMLVGGVEKSGALEMIGEQLASFTHSDLLVATLVILWASAIISAIVDNIPFTIAMIPIIKHLQTQGIDVEPLWWALAFGAGFGGNGSPIGSTAGVVIVSMSEKTAHPITFGTWLKVGIPAAFVALVVASIAFIAFFGWFTN